VIKYEKILFFPKISKIIQIFLKNVVYLTVWSLLSFRAIHYFFIQLKMDSRISGYPFLQKKIDTPLFVLIKNLFMIIRINEQKKIS